MATEYDAVVVGMGPVGMCCARLLAQSGHHVAILEQHNGDIDKSTNPRAINMDPETLRAFQTMGLVEEFEQTVVFIPGKQVVSSSYLRGGDCEVLNGAGMDEPAGSFSRGWPGKDAPVLFSPAGFQLGGRFYQPALEKVMRDSLQAMPNVQIHYNSSVVDWEQTQSGVELNIRVGEAGWNRTSGNEWVMQEPPLRETELSSIKTRYVIGCDGARSCTRKRINPDHNAFTSLGFDQLWLVVDVMLADESVVGTKLPYYLQQIADPHRICTYVPGSRVWNHPKKGRHIRWEFKLLEGESQEQMACAESVHRLLAPWLRPEEYTLVRSAVYQFHSLIAPKWRSSGVGEGNESGRVFIAGDAAHVMPPFRGMGMCQGFDDATNLCWKLSLRLQQEHQGQTQTQRDFLLESYQAERYSVALTSIKDSVKVGEITQALADAELRGTQREQKNKLKNTGYAHFNKQSKAASSSTPEAVEIAAAREVAEAEILASAAIKVPIPIADVGLSPIAALHGAVFAKAETQQQTRAQDFIGRYILQPPGPIATDAGLIGRLDDLIACAGPAMFGMERGAGSTALRHRTFNSTSTTSNDISTSGISAASVSTGQNLVRGYGTHGYRFALIARAGISARALGSSLSPRSQGLVSALNCAVLSITDDDLGGLLDTCDVALVRPDRVIFGLASAGNFGLSASSSADANNSLPHIDDMLADLESQIVPMFVPNTQSRL